MLEMLFMIERLILNSYYLVALPDHTGVSLSYLSNYSLHLSPYRLFTSKLILVQWHNYIALILTLNDLLIILLVNLRKNLLLCALALPELSFVSQ